MFPFNIREKQQQNNIYEKASGLLYAAYVQKQKSWSWSPSVSCQLMPADNCLFHPPIGALLPMSLCVWKWITISNKRPQLSVVKVTPRRAWSSLARLVQHKRWTEGALCAWATRAGGGDKSACLGAWVGHLRDCCSIKSPKADVGYQRART